METIDTPSANVVTIVDNLTSLREDNSLELHDGCYKPDKFESTSSPSISVVNIISVPPNNYKPMVYTNVDEVLFIFKAYGKRMKLTPS